MPFLKQTVEFNSRKTILLFNRDNLPVLRELAALELIKNTQICSCGRPMRHIKNKSKNSGYGWTCNDGVCNNTRSVC